MQVTQSSPELKLLLPPEWFEGDTFIGEVDSEGGEDTDPTVLLGFRSRVNLCTPKTSINCGVEPEKCTECSLLLEASINGTDKIATVSHTFKN